MVWPVSEGHHNLGIKHKCCGAGIEQKTMIGLGAEWWVNFACSWQCGMHCASPTSCLVYLAVGTQETALDVGMSGLGGRACRHGCLPSVRVLRRRFVFMDMEKLPS
jgi:hypothetical protein